MSILGDAFLTPLKIFRAKILGPLIDFGKCKFDPPEIFRVKVWATRNINFQFFEVKVLEAQALDDATEPT